LAGSNGRNTTKVGVLVQRAKTPKKSHGPGRDPRKKDGLKAAPDQRCPFSTTGAGPGFRWGAVRKKRNQSGKELMGPLIINIQAKGKKKKGEAGGKTNLQTKQKTRVLLDRAR